MRDGSKDQSTKGSYQTHHQKRLCCVNHLRAKINNRTKQKQNTLFVIETICPAAGCHDLASFSFLHHQTPHLGHIGRKGNDI